MKKRASVTDSMKTVQEKLRSAVDRKLVRFEDRGGFWLCVPGEKGHKKYIYNIRARLKADHFEYKDNLGWYKLKSVQRDAPRYGLGLQGVLHGGGGA